MGIKFVHTADWQIGRAFGKFDAGTAARLEVARLDCIERIGAVARVGGARHVLVAGDVYDSPDLASKVLRHLMEALRAQPDLRWWLLPGNHDPARSGGVWDRILGFGLPANVTALLAPGAHILDDGVHLLAAPLVAKQTSQDPTAWMDDFETPAGAIRIGLAHGSITTFSSEGDGGIIDPARAKGARLEYLALGDWHGTTQVDSRTWYSGTPEPDRFRDNAAGNVLFVQVDGPGAVPAVTPHRTARYTWVQEAETLQDVDGLARVEARVLSRASLPSQLLVRLALTGRLSASAQSGLAAWREGLEGKVCHLEVDASGLGISVDPTDFAALGDDRALQTVAERLAQAAIDGPNERREVAKAALAKLFDLVSRMPAGAP